MSYCTKCGKELIGAKQFCSNCGYPTEPDEEVSPRSESHEVEPISETSDQEDYSDANIPDAAIKVNKDCIECGAKSETKCFFCSTYVCDRHSSKMQILADKSAFGDEIIACGNCADQKRNTQPTEAEAKEIGFFFKVKPYHQWTILH
jgi:hypothetical protein